MPSLCYLFGAMTVNGTIQNRLTQQTGLAFWPVSNSNHNDIDSPRQVQRGVRLQFSIAGVRNFCGVGFCQENLLTLRYREQSFVTFPSRRQHNPQHRRDIYPFPGTNVLPA